MLIRYLPEQLQGVWLANGYKKNKNGSLEVTDPTDLHMQITEGILFTQPCISGPELKYVREEMDYTKAQLGRLLDISAKDMKILEKSQKIPSPTARLLRLVYDDSLGLGEICIEERAKEYPSARRKNTYGLVLICEPALDKKDAYGWHYVRRPRAKLDTYN